MTLKELARELNISIGALRERFASDEYSATTNFPKRGRQIVFFKNVSGDTAQVKIATKKELLQRFGNQNFNWNSLRK
jgi:hypothetical protein